MKIHLVKGDITKIQVDAIVNAANNGLQGGGGVDGAIHRAGGPEIMKECDLIRKKSGGCPTGEAVITSAGNLPAKYVIHTVGPVWEGGRKSEPELLRKAYTNSLRLAVEKNLESIAFPNISTGVYRFPKKMAAEIAVDELKNFKHHSLKEAFFVCYDDENFSLYDQILNYPA